MYKTILVAYASRLGSTREVAEAIAQELRDLDQTACVRSVDDVTDLSPYQVLILGSPIRDQGWLPEAFQFVERNREALSHMPVAYFVVCLTMHEDTKETRQCALHYLEPVCQMVQPIAIGLFGGVLDFKKCSWLKHSTIKEKKLIEGDFRDWDAICQWADDVEAAILNA